MSLPDYLDLDPAIILKDSRLKEFMLQADYVAGDAEEDIQRLLEERGISVIRRLRQAAAPYSWPFTSPQLTIAYPDESGGQRTQRDADQKTEAKRIVKELSITALLNPLGDERSDRAARAVIDGRGETTSGVARVGSIDETLKSLEAEIREVALLVSKAAGKRRSRGCIKTGRGDYSETGYNIINSGEYIDSLESP